MSDTAISARQLVKWFGEGDAKTYAVRNVDFDAYFGEMLYLVGPSGSGKTTLLSMISGNSGQIRDPCRSIKRISGTWITTTWLTSG